MERTAMSTRRRIVTLVQPMVVVLLMGSAIGQSTAMPQPDTDSNRVSMLIDDLRDDEVRWNASNALRELSRMNPPPIDALEIALQSDDWQQRQLAAAALRQMPSYRPSRAFCRVLVEGLRDDDLPRHDPEDGEAPTMTWVFNAIYGVKYLLERPRIATEELAKGLSVPDVQGRFWCAFVLGMTGRHEYVDDAAPILIEHLGDNQFGSDGVYAAAALYRFGMPVLPYLESARFGADRQMQSLIDLIVLDLFNPPRTPSDFAKRAVMHNVSELYHDPIVEFRFGSPEPPCFHIYHKSL